MPTMSRAPSSAIAQRVVAAAAPGVQHALAREQCPRIDPVAREPHFQARRRVLEIALVGELQPCLAVEFTDISRGPRRRGPRARDAPSIKRSPAVIHHLGR